MFPRFNRARVTFTKWARSEPNPDDRGENCAMVNVRRSYWNDWPCTTKFSFICKARGEMGKYRVVTEGFPLLVTL